MSFQMTPEATAKLLRWSLTGDTGISSQTIACIAVGIERKDAGTFGFDIPRDSADFGRCYRLLKAVPDLRAALPLVAEKFPKYGPLVEDWDHLSKLYELDLADRNKGVKSSRCYDRIKELHDACMLAGGYVQLGKYHWVLASEEGDDE